MKLTDGQIISLCALHLILTERTKIELIYIAYEEGYSLEEALNKLSFIEPLRKLVYHLMSYLMRFENLLQTQNKNKPREFVTKNVLAPGVKFTSSFTPSPLQRLWAGIVAVFEWVP